MQNYDDHKPVYQNPVGAILLLYYTLMNVKLTMCSCYIQHKVILFFRICNPTEVFGG